jgi:hypothetical protein
VSDASEDSSARIAAGEADPIEQCADREAPAALAQEVGDEAILRRLRSPFQYPGSEELALRFVSPPIRT